MKTCTHEIRIEQWFDTGAADDPGIRGHLESCETCRAHLAFLELARANIRDAREAPGIGDAQFHSFMGGIREKRQEKRVLRPALWTFVSAAAAACIVAVSMLTIVSPGAPPVEARSTVESTETDIEGATTQSYHDADGTAIVWINVPEGDMW